LRRWRAEVGLQPDVPEPLLGIEADVTDDASVRAAVDTAAKKLGGIDVLVNNAGIGAVEDNTDDEWRKVFEVNVFGIVRAPAPRSRGVLGEVGQDSETPTRRSAVALAQALGGMTESRLRMGMGTRWIVASGVVRSRRWSIWANRTSAALRPSS
jgi:NAD(P)-dependent dehydrogenase (short-subunit alcohol dehydrogenase family)